MGVINNLIEIRKKFRAIVGANWDGTTLSTILENRPISKAPFVENTSSTSFRFNNDIVGYSYVVQRFVNNRWSDLGGYISTGLADVTISLSAITETTTCRIKYYPYGQSKDVPLYTNEFIVTRTEAQSQSLKNGANIETTETETIDVVKTDIKKG